MRIGIIGLDTSHSVAFAKLLNQPDAPGHVPGGRIVAAVKTFSADMPASAERVEGYVATMVEEFGVQLVPSIEELCETVDAVLIESLDGRAHLEQARRVIAAHKPVFVDKPIAGTLRDAQEIFRLAQQSEVPVFSSSAYRFYESLIALQKTDVGEVRSAISYGPAYLDEHHPDLFFYGIHPVEALYTVLGRGCESVVRSHTADSDVVTGTWSGGRLGVLHGLRTKAIPHKVIVFGSTGFAEQQPTGERFRVFGTLGAAQLSGGDSYVPLLRHILDFFRTGVPPVSAEETMEMFAFMEAADESKRRGGRPVKLSEVIEAASQPDVR
ncbi:MAG: Gfo/Idh/MocA family oxidoreductase [Chthoniobacter sp.]|nr:Gfo/Idh/MocA family oxidoreductase [Chthoniobacter sp.]